MAEGGRGDVGDLRSYDVKIIDIGIHIRHIPI